MSPFPRAVSVVAFAALLAGATGCGGAIRSAAAGAAEGAVPAVTQEGLRQMEDQQTRARVAAVIATPEVQQALQAMTAGLAQGVVKGMSSDEMNAHMSKLVGMMVRTIMTEVARGMNDDLAAVASITGSAIDAAYASAMSPAHQKQIELLTSAILSSVMKTTAKEIPETLAPAMHKAMLDDIGPAVREMMQKDLAPGMAALVRSPDFKAAMGEVSHDVAKHAVLGSNEALAELSEKRKNDLGGMPLGFVGSLFAGRTWILVALGTALVFAIPLLWLLRERRLTRKHREETERRNARAAALIGAMEAAPDGAWSSSVLQMLRKELIAETMDPAHSKPLVDAPPPPRPRHV